MLLTVTLLLFSLAVQGLSQQQCFTERGCVGNVVDTPGPTATDCCVGTDDGLSFGIDSNNCEYQMCIVHGFERISYMTIESQTLTGINFVSNVKGTGGVFLIDGRIIALDDTGSTDDDIDDFQIRILNEGAGYSAEGMQIIPREDTLSLEDGDRIKLQFIPDDAQDTPEAFLQATGEFIRDITYVNIIDDDRLTINFGSLDYDVDEDKGPITIAMSVRGTQRPFTLILTPTTIDDAFAVPGTNVADFVSDAYMNSRPEARATPGQDYDATQIVLEIPKADNEHIVQQSIIIYNDDIDEVEQRFIIIGEFGADVPDSAVCFRVNHGDSGCIGNGRKGATGVGINDNDPMIIGFIRREQTVSETLRSGVAQYDIRVEIKSMLASEIDYELGVRVLGPTQQTSSDQAVVEAFDEASVFRRDATFGSREIPNDSRSNLIVERRLDRNETDAASLTAIIISDFLVEETECFDLSIYPINTEFMTEYFVSNDTASFFEKHTICILDDDEPFRVAFDETIYSVIESELAVNVCVNLTAPREGVVDILEEVVTVKVYSDSNSMYLPPDPNFATPDIPNRFNGNHPMAPRTDYEEETSRFSTIRDTFITELRRMICYEQVVYDDLRLEKEEYVGLALVPDDLDTAVETEPLYNESVVIIIDDDSARVGLEQVFYHVTENISFVELCAVVYEPVIDCPIEFPFAVQLSTIDNTAVDPMDYESLNMILMFDTCDTIQCVRVTIVDDFENEPDENFFYTLTRPPGGLDSRITLNPTLGEILIRDNDVPFQVGYDPTVHVTSENEGFVVLNICFDIVHKL